MRYVPLLSSALLVVVILAACTTAAPGWTYMPAPSADAGRKHRGLSRREWRSLGRSQRRGSGAPSPAGSGSGSTDVVQISALGVKFEQTDVTVPAGAPFQIQFENKDAGTPHNVAIHQGGPTGPELFKGEIFDWGRRPGPTMSRRLTRERTRSSARSTRR